MTNKNLHKRTTVLQPSYDRLTMIHDSPTNDPSSYVARTTVVGQSYEYNAIVQQSYDCVKYIVAYYKFKL